jgi:prolipoprotein diacylglyceryltransferase
MRPELFHIGPFPVYSFGLMMAIAFLTANYLLTRELNRRWNNEEKSAAFSSNITLIALLAGVSGSKLFHILENPELLLRNGISEIFSGSGLTFFGGLLAAIFCIFLYLRKKGVPFLFIADVAAPGLILAYGIGRVGCQLAGDGDYGIPSTLPWAMGYPNGTVPTLSALNPELASKWMEMNPGQPLPVDIMVHPTPVYETHAEASTYSRSRTRVRLVPGWSRFREISCGVPASQSLVCRFVSGPVDCPGASSCRSGVTAPQARTHGSLMAVSARRN